MIEEYACLLLVWIQRKPDVTLDIRLINPCIVCTVVCVEGLR
jgi:hypothetical protein